MTLLDILAALRALAPEALALPGDPVGLLVGSEDARSITKIGLCLDATPEACARAVKAGAELVVCHHPLIYTPLKRLDPQADPIARAALTLARADVALYAMHTNWDRVEGGVNDCLATLLDLVDVHPLGTDGEAALPRIGTLPAPRPLSDFVRLVERALTCTGTNALRCLAPDSHKMISRVAVCGGAGAGQTRAVHAAGADAYVTSDVRHHEFLEADGLGLALLDAGHDATETPAMRDLCTTLTHKLPGVECVWVGA